MKIIRNKMVTVRHKVDKNQNDIVELKSLKKDFKKLWKRIFIHTKKMNYLK